MVSNLGLGIVILGTLVLVLALIDDGHRALSGEITITEWATRKWYRQWLLVAGAALIPVGLGIHFYFF